MRAIANGQVDGFPPKSELRTVYVEHDIDAELSDISVTDYVLADPNLQGARRACVLAASFKDGRFSAGQAGRCTRLLRGHCWHAVLPYNVFICVHASACLLAGTVWRTAGAPAPC